MERRGLRRVTVMAFESSLRGAQPGRELRWQCKSHVGAASLQWQCWPWNRSLLVELGLNQDAEEGG